MSTFFITAPRERPDFRTLIAFLWNDSRNVDSDGDADHPASRTWTELTLELRDTGERVDVDPVQDNPLVLKVTSADKYIAARTAFILVHYMQGSVARDANGPYESPETLLPDMGEDFDWSAAMQRFRNSPFARSTREGPYPNLERG